MATGKKNKRTIFLDEEAGEIIRQYFNQRTAKQLQAGQPLFTSRRREEPLTRQGIWLILKEYGEKSEFQV